MTILASGGWRAAGACLSADPDLFFPVSVTGLSVAQVDKARGICASCMVMRQCLDFALEAKITEGIWAAPHLMSGSAPVSSRPHGEGAKQAAPPDER
jgi:WhiB family transcriptional regulator, redox-sensing transcriptional regulator